MRFLAILIASAVINAGCATEVQRATCNCEVRSEATGLKVCSMEQDARTFKRRPILERLHHFITSLFGA